jgi:hypothetical protein
MADFVCRIDAAVEVRSASDCGATKIEKIDSAQAVHVAKSLYDSDSNPTFAVKE